jgi:hypothetical protein
MNTTTATTPRRRITTAHAREILAAPPHITDAQIDNLIASLYALATPVIHAIKAERKLHADHHA